MAGLRPESAGRITERQQQILKLIIQEYVATGRPVGSKTLTERYNVGVSSATIRNEMADLEELGFLEKNTHLVGKNSLRKGLSFLC